MCAQAGQQHDDRQIAAHQRGPRERVGTLAGRRGVQQPSIF